MAKLRLVGKCVAPDVQSDARVSARAVPVTAISLQLAERRRHLSHGRFELLQADHIRPLALDPFENLSLARTDPVDVPGGDFQHLEIIERAGAMFKHGWDGRMKDSDLSRGFRREEDRRF